MLELALQGQLPLIRVQTQDTVNFSEIIEYLTGIEPQHMHPLTVSKISRSNSTLFWGTELSSTPEDLYQKLLDEGKTCILVNSDEDGGVAFDAGMVPTPEDMVISLLDDILDTSDTAPLLQALGGLTLKEVSEVCNLTMARDEALTPDGVINTRKMCATTIRGIEQVETRMDCYFENKRLEDWLNLNGSFFLKPKDRRLMPRGLLLNGSSGVGKTSGAKRIAGALNLPLYRLDLATMMTKWLGESEGLLKAALAQVDTEQPAILLIDEVEKVFQYQGDDSGSTTRMLSQLLWWLQEHQTAVLTIMTTNDKDSLPPELYRAGRIDQVFVMRELTKVEMSKMVPSILDTFPHVLNGHRKRVETLMARWISDRVADISHAALTQEVYTTIKKVTV